MHYSPSSLKQADKQKCSARASSGKCYFPDSITVCTVCTLEQAMKA